MSWLSRRIQKFKKSLFGAKWQENQSGVRYLERWVAEAAQNMPPGSWVLDAGSGSAPFRRFFEHVHYETADHLKNPYAYFPPTYICDLSSIPVDDGSYDMVICTQVLEHVPDPVAVLKELARILKDNGVLMLSAPLFFEEHEGPYDFFRYTRWGFLRLAVEAGLEVKEIKWVEGYHATLAHQLSIAAQSLAPSHLTKISRWYEFLPMHIFIFMLRLQFGLLARLFTFLDMRLPDTTHGMCMNYRLIMVKTI